MRPWQTIEYGVDVVDACGDHFDSIEEAALEHYRHDPGRPVALTVRDFECSWTFAADA